jgi:hypothetical protein
MTAITTTAKSTAKGVSIVAKGKGKQRTVTADPAFSADQAHGEAAGTLALVLDLPWQDTIRHETDGDTHRFIWE